MEQESTAGFFRASDVSPVLNNEFLLYSPNQRDAPFNNLRPINAPVFIDCGIPDSAGGGTQWLPMGKWYVDDVELTSALEVRLRATDRWNQLDGVTLTTAFTTLGSEVSSFGTSLNTIVVLTRPDVAGFTASGTLQIDNEFVTYSGTQASPPAFTGCSRGRAGTPTAVHGVYSPVSQAFINVSIDDLVKRITDSAGIGSDEVQVPTVANPAVFYQSNRRIIFTTTGSVTGAQLLGDHGGYGLIGDYVPVPTAWGGQSFGLGRNRTAWGYWVMARSGNEDSFTRFVGDTVQHYPFHVAIYDGSWNQLFGARTNLLNETAVNDPGTGEYFLCAQPTYFGAGQMGVFWKGYSLFEGNGTNWWVIYYAGLDRNDAWDVTWQTVYAKTNNNGQVSRIYDRGHAFGRAQVPQDGPAACYADADALKLYVAYYVNTTVVIHRYDLDSLGTPISGPTTVYTAGATYKKATGLAKIPVEENPLNPGGLTRMVMACEDANGNPVLVLLDVGVATLTVVEDAKCVVKPWGISWNIEVGSPDRYRILGLLGGIENGVVAGPVPPTLGYLAQFDMTFPHMQVRRTTDAVQPEVGSPSFAVYRNGTAWVENTDYRFERGLNYSRIAFEHLLTNQDLVTADYQFRFSVANAAFSGMRASEALQRAAAIPGYWIYFDESERLVFRPRTPSGASAFLAYNSNEFRTDDKGNKTTPNVVDRTVRIGKENLRNRVKITFTSARTGQLGASVVVDESALNEYSGTQVRTSELYGTRDLEVSNPWVYNLIDAQVMATGYLQYLKLRAVYETTVVLQPHLQLPDLISNFDGVLKIGAGSASQAIRPTSQTTTLVHDLDSRTTRIVGREV